MPVPANYRWLFTDPVAVTTYRVPINPNKMSSPFRVKQTSTLTNPQGRIRTRVSGANAPYEWTFSGVIRDMAHHDALLLWSRKKNLITITDHLGREWECLPQRFDAVEQRPSAQIADKFEYTFTVLITRGPL